jgi:hypothetical protein
VISTVPKKRKEPTQRTKKGLEIPVPKRADWDATLGKVIKPSPDRLQEEAAEQEGEPSADD